MIVKINFDGKTWTDEEFQSVDNWLTNIGYDNWEFLGLKESVMGIRFENYEDAIAFKLRFRI